MADSQTGNADPKLNPAEMEEFVPSSENELRFKIIDDFGLNEDEQSELIDKMVSDKMEEQKRLSTAIKQKIAWREKAKVQIEPKPEVKPQPVVPKISDDELDKKLEEKLEKRELDALDLDDELKQEVKRYSQLNGVSVKQALNSSYIQFRKKEFEDKKETDAASISSTSKNRAKKDFGEVNPAKDFDLQTEEGRQKFAEYKSWLKTQG